MPTALDVITEQYDAADKAFWEASAAYKADRENQLLWMDYTRASIVADTLLRAKIAIIQLT